MHKRIGILGGMSPESTAEYYQHITRTYTERFGDHNYPEIVIYSVRFQPYIEWQRTGRWALIAAGLREAARRLAAAGAELIVIATNTMHMVFDEVQAGVDVPMLSLLEAVGDEIQARGMRTVGLLGTRYTMELPFYPRALGQRGISVLAPAGADVDYINDVIYNELINGQIREPSRAGFLRIIGELTARGAEGIILGCTEIPLLVNERDAGALLLDTTAIHAEAALRRALGE